MKTTFPTFLKLILIYTTLFAKGEAFDTATTHSTPSSILHQLCSDSEEKTVISGLSFNVWGLPIWMPGQDQDSRFQKLADSLSVRDFDIICLQEVFNKRVRNELKQKVLPLYFHASDYDCNQNILSNIIQKDCHGGLMTLSKFPILQERFYKFKTSKKTSIIERLGGKGFLFTTVLWQGRPINIINTHLYAGNDDHAIKCRMDQIKQMQEILNSIDFYQLYPTLLFGDLNIIHPDVCTEADRSRAENYDFLTKEMNFMDNGAYLDNNSYTINPDINVYNSKKEVRQKLDYIMVHNPSISDHALVLYEGKIDFSGRSALSDHLGWKTTISFKKKKMDESTFYQRINNGLLN